MITIADVINAVALESGLAPEDLTSDIRYQTVSRPRAIALLLIRQLTDKSFPQIGAAFGISHPAVIDAIKRAAHYCEKSEGLKALYLRSYRRLT